MWIAIGSAISSREGGRRFGRRLTSSWWNGSEQTFFLSDGHLISLFGLRTEFFLRSNHFIFFYISLAAKSMWSATFDISGSTISVISLLSIFNRSDKNLLYWPKWYGLLKNGVDSSVRSFLMITFSLYSYVFSIIFMRLYSVWQY